MRYLDDVLDDLGFGKAQVTMLSTAGMASLLSGVARIGASVVATSIAYEWSLGDFQKASLVSVMYFGDLIGNAIAGIIADTYGRRFPILLTFYVMVLAAVGAGVLSTGYYSLMCWRLLIGIGCGIGSVVSSCYFCEICPRNWRLEMNVILGVLFDIGASVFIALAWLQDGSLQHLHWRWLTVWTAVPGLAFLLASHHWLLESPRFLELVSAKSAATEMLGQMAAQNGKQVDVANWESRQVLVTADVPPLSVIFSKELRWTSCTVCFSFFTLMSCYYGMMYALPQVLPGLHLNTAAAASMLLSISGEVVGCLAGVCLAMRVTRLSSLLIYLAGLGACVLMLLVCVPFLSRSRSAANGHGEAAFEFVALAVNLAVYGNAFFVAIGWNFVYTYASEVYPTACRARGLSTGVGLGRLGAIFSPMIFEGLRRATSRSEPFFGLLLVMACLNACLVWSLPLETKDRQLGEIEAEIKPVQAKFPLYDSYLASPSQGVEAVPEKRDDGFIR